MPHHSRSPGRIGSGAPPLSPSWCSFVDAATDERKVMRAEPTANSSLSASGVGAGDAPPVKVRTLTLRGSGRCVWFDVNGRESDSGCVNTP